jgi:hypothetical protein
MLTILDSISVPGNPEKPNDDAFAFIDHAAVVMDGATGLGDPLMPGKSDAAWLATFGARRLVAYAREGASPRDAVTAALFDAQTSFEALRRRPPKENYEIPYASMMFVAQTTDRDPGDTLQYLWFGDCAALVSGGSGTTQIIGDALDKRALEACRVARLAEKHGLSPAAGVNRPEYLAALRKARNYTNTEKGHWAFAPEPSAADHVQGIVGPAVRGSRILLVTDGFLALASDYQKYDATGLLEAAQSKGLKALTDELRAVERDDVEGRKFPRFKTSDDATALLLRLD